MCVGDEMVMHLPVQVEPKHRIVHQILCDHVIEHRGYPINRDGGIAHPKNAIKLCSNKGDAGLFDGFTKSLANHSYTSNLTGVVREEW